MSNVDLLNLFGSVAGALQNSQADLNKADTRNGDHGESEHTGARRHRA